jgi:hypothetical protein
MKKFFVYVLACFLLCNSVLADFEDSVYDSVEAAPSEPVEVAPSDPVETAPSEFDDFEVTPDETQLPLEKVDENISSVPDLVTPSVPEFPDSGDVSEVSPGGNTVYVLSKPFEEGDSIVGTAPSYPVLTASVVATGLAPVTPSDTTGLKAVLLSFIGNYDPPVVQYEYTTSNNYKQYVNEIQPDYVWICSFALIALFIYCLFKLGGALLRV